MSMTMAEFEAALLDNTSEVYSLFEERAGILEFDANMTRQKAEVKAKFMVLSMMNEKGKG